MFDTIARQLGGSPTKKISEEGTANDDSNGPEVVHQVDKDVPIFHEGSYLLMDDTLRYNEK